MGPASAAPRQPSGVPPAPVRSQPLQPGELLLVEAALALESAERAQTARQFTEAAEQAARGLETAQARPLKIRLLQVRAQALESLGDNNGAFEAHRQILALATSRRSLGEQLYELGRASHGLGKSSEAARALRAAVEEFPGATTTAEALRLLDNLGAADELDPYALGRARYAAGDFRNAVRAFDRSLAQPGGPDAASARLYRALAGLVPGNEVRALRELDALAEDASLDAETRAQALLDSGQALEGLNDLEAAERQYARLVERFPRLDAASTAAFRLGLARYARGADGEAVRAWETLLARRADLESTEVARVLYWRGKAQVRLGDAAAARAGWQEAGGLTPVDYYVLRSLDALGQLGTVAAASDEITPDEEAQLDSWLLDRGLTGLQAARSSVASDPALARAEATASLGLLRQASWEAEELAQRYAERADRLYVLARRFQELGLAGGSTRLGQAALEASGGRDQRLLALPSALRKIAYPRPFARLAGEAAERHGIDPFLLEALLLMTSDFDPWAENTASGARGLGQLSPVQAEEAQHGTGSGADAGALFRPEVSIELQAWYLAARLRRFGGRPEAALAALETGDRAVDTWLARESGVDDLDLFVERVDYEGVRAELRGQLAARLVYAATYQSASRSASRSAIEPRLPGREPVAAGVKIGRVLGELPPSAPFSPVAAVGTAEEGALLARGARLQRDGDHQAALELYAALGRDSANPAVLEAARRRRTEALLGSGHPTEAVAELARLSAEADPDVAYLHGRALLELGRCAEAEATLRTFVATAPPFLAAHGQSLLARCLQTLGRHREAVSLMELAARAEGQTRLQVLAMRERLALTRLEAGDIPGAQAEYESLLAAARSASYRAELSYALGVLSSDTARLRAAVQLDSKGPAARAALDELIALGDPFATTSFEAAETRFEQDRYLEALRAYEAFIAANPRDARAPRAAYARGVALVRLNQDRAGVQALAALREQYPRTPEAADGLFRSGRVLESLADLDGAADAYASVAGLPAAGARELDARFRLAFVQLRKGDFRGAAGVWRELAGKRVEPDDRAQALFWLGKALEAAGDQAGARTAWTQAHTADPGGYYSLRAGDYLAGGEARDARAQSRGIDLNISVSSGVRSWVASRRDLATLERRVYGDPALAQAERLLGLGLRREASWVLGDLADRLGRDAESLALLAAWEDEHGLYNAELTNSFRVAGNASLSLRTGPEAVRRLGYPLPHPEVLARASADEGVDPRLFAGLIRQESALDQYVESAAQARGLTQLIASTAHDAARALRRFNFRTTELFQPQASIRLGAYTFGRRLARYDQRIFPALAAYNATQVAVDGWLLATGEDDMDLFAEAIPFTETYPYVQTIYENYRQYIELYGAR